MGRRKKQKPDLDKLNPDDVLMETVACSLLGRTLASYASTITGREKANRELVYTMLNAGRKPSSNLPVVARITKTERSDQKRYTPAEAIKQFSQEYPKDAQPLLRLLEERHSVTDPALEYGLRDGSSLDDEYLIEVLQKMLPITRGPARTLYEKIIKPEMARQKEEERLVSVAIKE